MKTRSAVPLYGAVMAALLISAARPAEAQFQPRPISEPATGESYHIEAAAGFWMPTADMQVASEALGQVGTTIDFKEDLGLTDQRFGELHLTLRPATKHKFRFQYIPIKYEQGPTTITRNIVFNGQLYSVGVPVNSSILWKAYRFGYEYDFLTKDRWFVGFVLDFKYTDVEATLQTPLTGTEFAHAAAPIPAVGGIFRAYVVPNISITGEITGFKLPENVVPDTTGSYIDVDFYGTLNFTNNVGVMVGYRSFDVGYTTDADFGDFRLKGLYLGGVLRY